MATQTVCDRCGKAPIPNATIAISCDGTWHSKEPGQTPETVTLFAVAGPNYDWPELDLCKRCITSILLADQAQEDS